MTSWSPCGLREKSSRSAANPQCLHHTLIAPCLWAESGDPEADPDATAGPTVRPAMQSMQDVDCNALETIIYMDILCLAEHIDTCMTRTVDALSFSC